MWRSASRFTRWLAIVLITVGFGAMAHIILPLFHDSQPADIRIAGLEVKWRLLQSTLSGEALAGFIFGNASGIIPYVPF